MAAKLRPLKIDDAVISVNWRNDSEIRYNIMGCRFPVSEITEYEWVENTIKTQGDKRLVFAIEDIKDNELVGYVYLDKIDWISGTAWVGVLLGKQAKHRQGIGKSAVTQIINKAKKDFNLHKILAEIIDFNDISLAFFQSLDFNNEATLKRHIYLDGNYHDIHIVSKFL
ncbi:MAG: GNAT family protein [Chryseobacterium sp.]